MVAMVPARGLRFLISRVPLLALTKADAIQSPRPKPEIAPREKENPHQVVPTGPTGAHGTGRDTGMTKPPIGRDETCEL